MGLSIPSIPPRMQQVRIHGIASDHAPAAPEAEWIAVGILIQFDRPQKWGSLFLTGGGECVMQIERV